jgi:hypothetical protein
MTKAVDFSLLFLFGDLGQFLVCLWLHFGYFCGKIRKNDEETDLFECANHVFCTKLPKRTHQNHFLGMLLPHSTLFVHFLTSGIFFAFF